MASKLDEFRSQNPVYDDVPDNRLVPALHKKFYSDMPEAEFHQAIGYSPASPSPVDRAKSGLTDLYNLPGRVIQAGTEALAAPKSVIESYQPATAAEAPRGRPARRPASALPISSAVPTNRTRTSAPACWRGRIGSATSRDRSTRAIRRATRRRGIYQPRRTSTGGGNR